MTLIEQRVSGKKNMISDFEKWVKDLEKQRKMNFPLLPVMGWAHRAGTTHREGIRVSGPWPKLATFLNFQDKLKILQLTWEKEDLLFQGSRVYIYPDFSAGVLDKHWQFKSVKKMLSELDIKCSLQYPALVRVIHKGTSTLYRTPTEGEAFLR